MTEKLDPKARVMYSEGYQGERDFKVLLKDPSCGEEIKGKYRVKAKQGNILILSLTYSELKNLLKDECVQYVSPAQRLEFK
mgnify:CR=1 FL=1